jgi:hypothetical protein
LRPVVVAASGADQVPHDESVDSTLAARQIESNTSGHETVQAVGRGSAGLAAPDKAIRLTFRPIGDGSVQLLRVDNGYAKVLRYRARLDHPGGDRSWTSVCLVAPRIASNETWSEPILQIELSSFSFVDRDPALGVQSLADCN